MTTGRINQVSTVDSAGAEGGLLSGGARAAISRLPGPARCLATGAILLPRRNPSVAVRALEPPEGGAGAWAPT
jgi:hypothetical protein